VKCRSSDGITFTLTTFLSNPVISHPASRLWQGSLIMGRSPSNEDRVEEMGGIWVCLETLLKCVLKLNHYIHLSNEPVTPAKGEQGRSAAEQGSPSRGKGILLTSNKPLLGSTAPLKPSSDPRRPVECS